jgi:hypothetical protein
VSIVQWVEAAIDHRHLPNQTGKLRGWDNHDKSA